MVWQDERKGGLLIRAEPFGNLSSVVRDRVEEQGEALMRFLESIP